MATVTIDVDVELDDFDDDDLLEEVKSRKLNECDYDELATEMFYAFYSGHPEKAMEIARQIAQEVTGRVLP